mmetsp:Transcript_9857/g.18729  ORF Transcript_9857/g.18729 Transcript_9857/m.18729 type:complete len:203 (+) Transcript_9857:556-1164(+)
MRGRRRRRQRRDIHTRLHVRPIRERRVGHHPKGRGEGGDHRLYDRRSGVARTDDANGGAVGGENGGPVRTSLGSAGRLFGHETLGHTHGTRTSPARAQQRVLPPHRGGGVHAQGRRREESMAAQEGRRDIGGREPDGQDSAERGAEPHYGIEGGQRAPGTRGASAARAPGRGEDRSSESLLPHAQPERPAEDTDHEAGTEER